VDFLNRFLTLCREQDVTPDFVSGTHYVRTLESLSDSIKTNLQLMKQHGLNDTKYVLAEWHYGVQDWSRCAYVREHGFYEAENAAFSVSALIEMMDMDDIDVAYYYSWSTNNWALYNCHEGGNALLPVYYGLSFFQQPAVECTERIGVTLDAPIPAKTVAGKTADGKIRLLISCHECPFIIIHIECTEKNEACLKRITTDYCEELCTKGERVFAENGMFKVTHAGGSGVYLLEFDV